MSLAFLSTVLVVVSTTIGPSRTAAAASSAAPHAPLSAQAPADEYFGALHMSAIGIRMRIDVLGRRYHARTESDDDLIHDAGDVASALKVWNQRYPNDTWAAPTAYHLAQLYEEVQTTDARSLARSAFAYVASAYPTSKFAHLARLRVAQGFPPLHGESPVVASPSPSLTPKAEPAGSPTTIPVTASPAAAGASSAPSPKSS